MEYRLVIENNNGEVYTEASTEHLFTLYNRRRMLIRNKIVDPEHDIEAKQNLLSGRKWEVNQQNEKLGIIKFQLRVIGKNISIKIGNKYYKSSFVKNKIYFREQESLNTGVILESLSANGHYRITHGEYFDPIISSILCFLMVKKNRIPN